MASAVLRVSEHMAELRLLYTKIETDMLIAKLELSCTLIMLFQ
jgi:hypothetical protein